MSQNATDIDSLRFSETVNAGETTDLSVELERPATVEHVRIRIYPGTQLALQIQPYIQVGDSRIPLVRLFGRSYITGDNDTWEFEIAEPVRATDKIGVEVTNTDSQYAYDYSCDITVDYMDGTDRVVSRLMGVFN